MDSTLNLAYLMHKNPGIYALLVGSGISKSVGIPTGWDVTQDIVRQLQALGEDSISEDIGYDALLEMLSKKSDERSAILRGYFEPTEAERDQGQKMPSPAHRAIAWLVKAGYVKLILTTNFDRLLEVALHEQGITPDVIRSDDMLRGSRPLRHSPITIIQLHGDYQDVRTLNTAKELEKYSSEKNTYLDTIFNEYGLIICGWSATWDKALRDALYRSPQKRYSAYWIEPFQLSDEATELKHHLKAEGIAESADDFFVDLYGNVEALSKLYQEHPLSVAVAVERVKRLMPYEENHIQLEDLLRDSGEEAYQRLSKLEFNLLNTKLHEFYISTTQRYFSNVETSLSMATAICWYGKGQLTASISELVTRWATAKDLSHEWDNLRRIPPLLFMYACGIAAVYRANWQYLRALVSDSRITSFRKEQRFSVLEVINKRLIFDYDIYPLSIDEVDPVSNLLRSTLRPIFHIYIPNDKEYEIIFDLFEMLLTVISVNDKFGYFIHNAALREYAELEKWRYIHEFFMTGAKQGSEWGFVKEFFNGNPDELVAGLARYQQSIKNHQKWSSYYIHDYSEEYKNALPNS